MAIDVENAEIKTEGVRIDIEVIIDRYQPGTSVVDILVVVIAGWDRADVYALIRRAVVGISW